MRTCDRSTKFLFLASLFFLGNFAQASFKPEDDRFYPEIGVATDECQLTLTGGPFTTESCHQVSNEGGLDYATCRFSWLNSAESFREFYDVDYIATARSSFIGYSKGGAFDFPEKELSVRDSPNGVFAMDLVAVSNKRGVSCAALKLTPQAKEMLIKDRTLFHRFFKSHVIIGYCKGSRCIGLNKCNEENPATPMMKAFSCSALIDKAAFSTEFTVEQKKTMEEAFELGSLEFGTEYWGAPFGVPFKISNCEDLQKVFSIITKHVGQDNRGLKVNWISVPYEDITDYRATVASAVLPLTLPTPMASYIAQAYKALMEVRWCFRRISEEDSNNLKAKLALSELEEKILEIGCALVQVRPISSVDVALLANCESGIWPEEISQLSDPR